MQAEGAAWPENGGHLDRVLGSQDNTLHTSRILHQNHDILNVKCTPNGAKKPTGGAEGAGH
jgi:hypothetical protein